MERERISAAVTKVVWELARRAELLKSRLIAFRRVTTLATPCGVFGLTARVACLVATSLGGIRKMWSLCGDGELAPMEVNPDDPEGSLDSLGKCLSTIAGRLVLLEQELVASDIERSVAFGAAIVGFEDAMRYADSAHSFLDNWFEYEDSVRLSRMAAA